MLPPDANLRQLVDAYVLAHDITKHTAVTIRCAANSFSRWFGKSPSVHELSANFNAYLADHAKQGSRYTTKTYRGHLDRLIRFAASHGNVSPPHIVRPVKVPEHTPISFTDGEIDRLLAHADPRQRAAILLVHDSGFRYSDVFRTRWGDVDESWCAEIVFKKSGRREIRRLSQATVAACAALQKNPGPREMLVPFPWKSRTPWDDRWRALGARSGVNVFKRGLQAIRRRASSLVAVLHGPAVAAQFLGHSPHSGTAVFHRYYRIGKICDQPPPSPPPLIAQLPVAAPAPTPCGPTGAEAH